MTSSTWIAIANEIDIDRVENVVARDRDLNGARMVEGDQGEHHRQDDDSEDDDEPSVSHGFRRRRRNRVLRGGAHVAGIGGVVFIFLSPPWRTIGTYGG